MSRKVKLGTISMILDQKLTGIEYFDYMVQSSKQILLEAAEDKPDLMVLPEYFAHAQMSEGEKKLYAEKIPDFEAPLQKEMSELSRKIKSNIVFGIAEVEDDKYYNSAVVLDKAGRYVGKYRKVHLAPGEDSFFTPGNEFVVLDLDIGKLGIAICMDIHYPEMWTIMALEGADIIAHPTAWMDYTGNFCESIVNARAADNQNYVVTSHFVQVPYLAGRYPGHSRIVDPYGRTRADTSHIPGYAIASVDLDQLYEYWATGEIKSKMPTLKECFLGMRRPELYSTISKRDMHKKWKLRNPVIYDE